MPSSYIAPAEHIKMAEVFGPTDIRRATYIEHEWVWEVSNNSRSADGYLAFYLEYKHGSNKMRCSLNMSPTRALFTTKA